MVLFAKVFYIYNFAIAVGNGYSKNRHHYPSDAPMGMQNTMTVVAAKFFCAIHKIVDGEIVFHYPTPAFNGDLSVFVSVHMI
jgi:hypothetical protein